jgi:hypothetical protein
MNEISPIKASRGLNYDCSIVELDIGGKLFRTTKSTLCSQPDSFFSVLVNGNFKESRSLSKEPIFLDRDPTTFSSILSYLRSGHIFFTSEEDSVYLERLKLEVRFDGDVLLHINRTKSNFCILSFIRLPPFIGEFLHAV